jgi:hypothetical protein
MQKQGSNPSCLSPPETFLESTFLFCLTLGVLLFPFGGVCIASFAVLLLHLTSSTRPVAVALCGIPLFAV